MAPRDVRSLVANFTKIQAHSTQRVPPLISRSFSGHDRGSDAPDPSQWKKELDQWKKGLDQWIPLTKQTDFVLRKVRPDSSHDRGSDAQEPGQWTPLVKRTDLLRPVRPELSPPPVFISNPFKPPRARISLGMPQPPTESSAYTVADGVYHWRTRSPNARIVYMRDVRTADRELSRLRPGPLGFDLEWKPTFIKGQPPNPSALIQLASEDTVMLFQVSAMPALPSKLKEVLLDPAFLKIGVGIEKDCKKLYTDFAISVRGCVELTFLARSVDNARWKGRYASLIALARLCEAYEQRTLPKGRLQTSNWEGVLNDRQQDYAANDSHVAYSLYSRLAAMGAAMDSPPRAMYYTFNVVHGRSVQLNSSLGWSPHNPEYDPGPLPPPPPVRNGAIVNPRPTSLATLSSILQGRQPEGDAPAEVDTGGPSAPRPRRKRHGSFGSVSSDGAQCHSATPVKARSPERRKKARTRRRNRTGHPSQSDAASGSASFLAGSTEPLRTGAALS